MAQVPGGKRDRSAMGFQMTRWQSDDQPFDVCLFRRASSFETYNFDVGTRQQIGREDSAHRRSVR